MKNKGIVIELTALLDVILIMLFWVMMNVREETTNVRNEAEAQIEEYQLRSQEAQDELEAAQEELERIRAEYEKQLAEARAAAEVKDPEISAYQQALDDFSGGVLITLNLKYDAVGKLFIYDSSGELGRTLLDSEEDISDSITDALERSGLDREDIILCAFTYDGERALYRDIKRITSAVNDVTDTYRHLYCTYINTNR